MNATHTAGHALPVAEIAARIRAGIAAAKLRIRADDRRYAELVAAYIAAAKRAGGAA